MPACLPMRAEREKNSLMYRTVDRTVERTVDRTVERTVDRTVDTSWHKHENENERG